MNSFKAVLLGTATFLTTLGAVAQTTKQASAQQKQKVTGGINASTAQKRSYGVTMDSTAAGGPRIGVTLGSTEEAGPRIGVTMTTTLDVVDHASKKKRKKQQEQDSRVDDRMLTIEGTRLELDSLTLTDGVFDAYYSVHDLEGLAGYPAHMAPYVRLDMKVKDNGDGRFTKKDEKVLQVRLASATPSAGNLITQEYLASSVDIGQLKITRATLNDQLQPVKDKRAYRDGNYSVEMQADIAPVLDNQVETMMMRDGIATAIKGTDIGIETIEKRLNRQAELEREMHQGKGFKTLKIK